MTAANWFVTRARHPPDDPVNLVFTGRASAADVSRLLRRVVRPGWHRYGFGRGVADLTLGAALWGQRRHIRIYDCVGPPRACAADRDEGDVTDRAQDTWSVATVHLEHFDRRRRNHLIDSWNEPREYLKSALAALGPWLAGAIRDEDLGTAGRYHGKFFDGMVTFVELR